MAAHPAARPLVVYVDVDDTLVRSAGSKRFAVPSVVSRVRALKAQGARLFLWSTAGSEYARASSVEMGVEDCFEAFLPKPDVVLDDQPLADWRQLREVHPLNCDSVGEP